MNNAAVTHSSSPFAIIDKIQLRIQRRNLQTRFLIPVWKRISRSNFVASIALTLTETDTTTTEVRHVIGHEDRGKAGQNPKIDEAPRLTEQILMNYQDFLLYIGDFGMLGCVKGCRSPAHTPVPHNEQVGILKSLFYRGCWAACDTQGGMRVICDTQVGHNQEGEHCLSSKAGGEEGNKSLTSQNRRITQGYKNPLNPEGKPLQNARNSGSDEGGLLSTPCLVSRQNWWKIRWPN